MFGTFHLSVVDAKCKTRTKIQYPQFMRQKTKFQKQNCAIKNGDRARVIDEFLRSECNGL